MGKDQDLTQITVARNTYLVPKTEAELREALNEMRTKLKHTAQKSYRRRKMLRGINRSVVRSDNTATKYMKMYMRIADELVKSQQHVSDRRVHWEGVVEERDATILRQAEELKRLRNVLAGAVDVSPNPWPENT
jgi:hypothetical protein